MSYLKTYETLIKKPGFLPLFMKIFSVKTNKKPAFQKLFSW
ncbi:Uncharacterized protein dnm_005230 [Desulfonema magnum]|uniref:Uncharacterized protein n=1 Tax=Desulfonema magnum TaxID=45655 RepID=A0A975BFL5_9BACT|nr:Uncharacterized protein dnm_005230 [Desulfonema magnum]